jgi:putative transposase
MILVMGLWTFLRALLFGSAAIALENLALRHQLAVLQRSVNRPRLARWDRVFWVWLSRLWASWRSSLLIVQPATVLAWHRQGFRLYWRWKSRPNPVGRPRLDAELRDLIRRMARENPTWGRRRIRAELALLGYEVAELTVAKYMHRTLPGPSPTWRTFLTAHAGAIVAIDFCGTGQPNRDSRYRLNHSRARLATCASVPRSSNRCVATGTGTISIRACTLS